MEHRWKVLTVVSVAAFMASLDLFIVNVAFPELSRDFEGTSVAGLSWVLNAYAIVFAALLVPAGRAADRLGRRRAFLGGTLAFLAGSVLCGVAPSVEALVAARIVQAAGAAFLMPASLALLLPEFGPRERPAAIGVWAAVGGVAAALGPPVGGLLVEASWRLVFLVNVPVGLVALAFAVRLLRETRDETAERADLGGTVLLTLSTAGLVLGLVEAPDWGWGSVATLAVLAASAAGLALFWARCRTHSSPVVHPEMLQVRSFAMATLGQLLFSASFGAMLLGSVLLLTDVWDRSVLVAGLSIAPGPMLAAAFAVVSGRLAPTVGQHRLAAAGCATFAVGCSWWLWQVDATPAYATGILPGLLLTGIGVGFTLAPLASAAASSLPPTRFATGSAVLTMARQLGTVLGVAVLVAILGSGDASDPIGAFQGGWTFMVVSGLLASLAALRIGDLREPAPLVSGLEVRHRLEGA
ncbi:MFS transporter [Conexibacter sp. SYSU D00693]|uniref:MFS transporter n=1 Tax=Conexibacter sp. SYSU D00693 TaxID=2812560 RepID=UPI00196B083B|nr:MFS transporter [Conexibacter sp. SYSU D00693]